jgi:hypothetical protein
MKEIPVGLFDFSVRGRRKYEVVSETVNVWFWQRLFSKNKSKTKTRYYIQEYLGHVNARYVLCKPVESGFRPFFTPATNLYSIIYWDNPEEPIEIIERAKRGDIEGYKKPVNVIYTAQSDE